MKNLIRIAAAFTAGAAIMYYLDPQGGRRRRALVRDKGLAAGHQAQRLVRGKATHAADLTRGALARARSMSRSMFSGEPVADDVLHDRIRARLGHLVEYPGQLNIDVRAGYVVVRGQASIEEIEDIHAELEAMAGVTGVDIRISPAVAYARA